MKLLVLSLFLLSISLIGGSWVDPDTPDDSHSTLPMSPGDERKYELVFSDEFEQEGRTFHDGRDPRWTALNKNDYTNAALHFYSHDNARTENGVLSITTEQKVNTYKALNEKTKQFYSDKKYVQSAMLQGWNKFCFTGGIIEYKAKLPGDPKVGGLWPALWMLGNLARATYVGSSDYMWPYSFNQCDPRNRMNQAINACSKVNHFGLDPEVGRGAPEIDVIEAMQGDDEKLPNTRIRRPYQSCSLQVAPGIQRDRPNLGMKPKKGHWYEGMEYNTNNDTLSELNPFFYGVTLVHKPKSYTYQADALSANTQLKKSFYEEHHTYRVEWEPPQDDGSGGYIRWYTDDAFVYSVHGDNLNITGAEIPREAMYLLMNTAIASSWGFPAPCPEGCACECFECGNPDCACALPDGYCKNFPANFEIEYVRVYQAVNESKHTLGCSPEARPTSLYIEGHQEKYMEDGDKRPLEPVSKGGAKCISDIDCGAMGSGHCSSKGICVCNETVTGPTCLAHAGYYDFEISDGRPTAFGWSDIYVPKSLIVLVAILFIGFLGSMVDTMRHRVKSRRRYRKLNPNSGKQHHDNHHGDNSYQNSHDYALPPKQKVVTYCVIDGRLVDQSAATPTAETGREKRRT